MVVVVSTADASTQGDGIASFVDAGSGLRVRACRPWRDPELWRRYLDGAEERYRRHGVEHTLERPRISEGRAISLFWIVLDGDAAVAGMRCHGPLVVADDAAALRELAAHPSVGELHAEIAARLREGVVEVKGVWVAAGRADGEHLSRALARCYVHSLTLLRSRHALCTTADHALQRWMSSGGRVASLDPFPYPDERYRTVAMWWDRETIDEQATGEQLGAIAREQVELATTERGAWVADADAGWQPVVLDPDRTDDRGMIVRLLGDPSVRVVDVAASGRDELGSLLPPVGDDLVSESSWWIFYPWRSALVQTLGPRAYRRVRLDRNRNKITLEQQERLRGLQVGVVGLSVGHVIAHTLVLEGLCGEIRLCDFDRIELSNLNRIPATVLDVGVHKAVAAARRLYEVDPYLTVSVWPDGLHRDNLDAFLDGLDVVIEECDSLDLKLMVREAARARGIPVIMETSDRGMLDVERFDLEPERPIFHGLVDDFRAEEIGGLSTHDKVPVVLRILEPDQLSTLMAASMAEIDHTVSTWPQLAGDVTLGGASVAATLRRLVLGDLNSGRVRIDLDAQLDDLRAPEPVELVRAVRSPTRAAPGDDVEAIVQAANLAPSGGNTQPWRFVADHSKLEIHLAPERTSTMDMAFRGSYVAIGAALFNARVAAAAHAKLGSFEVFPTAGTDHVATLHFDDHIDLTLAELYPLVEQRTANRLPGTGEPIAPATFSKLRHAVESHGASLHCVSDAGTIAECVELFAESDRVRFLTPHLHSEMMSELRWPGYDPLETGIDVRTLELDRSDLAKLAVARRADIMAALARWDGGAALGDVMRERLGSSSAVVVITVPSTEPSAFVAGGQAVEQCWLEAQREGLAVQPVSPVFIYAHTDQEFAELVPDRAAHVQRLAHRLREIIEYPNGHAIALVLRLSYAPQPTFRSARLPVQQSLEREAAAQVR
jgi:molybdopterin/thiamine biosynthesis adenylyltransferase